MPPDDVIRLRHMLDAAQRCIDFSSQRQRQDLDSDPMLLFAIIRALEILGEAAARMSRDIQNLHPLVPWAQIVAMRNRLIHAYFDVDRDRVWLAATEEVPILLAQLRSITVTE